MASVLTATSLVRCACACFLALLGVIGTFDDVDDCNGPNSNDCDELVAATAEADV